jgi:hypothetical protein
LKKADDKKNKKMDDAGAGTRDDHTGKSASSACKPLSKFITKWKTSNQNGQKGSKAKGSTLPRNSSQVEKRLISAKYTTKQEHHTSITITIRHQ